MDQVIVSNCIKVGDAVEGKWKLLVCIVFWFRWALKMAYRQGGGYGRKFYGKSYRGKSWTTKKRRYGKKKSVKKSGSAVMRKLVREEAKRVLEKRQRVTMVSFPGDVVFYSSPLYAGYSYFRVPVSQAIPVQRGLGAPPDPRWREGDKIHVRYACVRMNVNFATSVAMMGVCYPARVQAEPVRMESAGEDRPATSFALGRKDGKAYRLLNLRETNFLSQDGPFEVIPGDGDAFMLHSNDQSLFNARLAKGAGAPVGKVQWRLEKHGRVEKGQTFGAEFHIASNMRTPDWGKPGGYVQMDTRTVEVYFAIDKVVEFQRAESNIPVFDPHLELMFGVRAMQLSVPKSLDGKSIDLGAVEAGSVSNVMVDLGFSSVQ